VKQSHRTTGLFWTGATKRRADENLLHTNISCRQINFLLDYP
jgi:hypothetical protein